MCIFSVSIYFTAVQKKINPTHPLIQIQYYIIVQYSTPIEIGFDHNIYYIDYWYHPQIYKQLYTVDHPLKKNVLMENCADVQCSCALHVLYTNCIYIDETHMMFCLYCLSIGCCMMSATCTIYSIYICHFLCIYPYSRFNIVYIRSYQLWYFN